MKSGRDCLRQVHAAPLANTQRLIKALTPRRFGWPWQRETQTDKQADHAQATDQGSYTWPYPVQGAPGEQRLGYWTL